MHNKFTIITALLAFIFLCYGGVGLWLNLPDCDNPNNYVAVYAGTAILTNDELNIFTNEIASKSLYPISSDDIIMIKNSNTTLVSFNNIWISDDDEFNYGEIVYMDYMYQPNWGVIFFPVLSIAIAISLLHISYIFWPTTKK